MNKKQKKMMTRIIIAAVLLVVLHFIPITGIPRFICYLAIYLEIGYDILKKAFKGIKNGQVFDENFLMALATVGAFGLAVYEKSGDYNEAIAVMLFCSTDSQHTCHIDTSADDLISRFCISRKTLTGQGTCIQSCTSFNDHTVDRHFFTRLYYKRVW